MSYEDTEKDRAVNQLNKLLKTMFKQGDEDSQAIFSLLMKMQGGVTLRDLAEQLIQLNRQWDKLREWIAK